MQTQLKLITMGSSLRSEKVPEIADATNSVLGATEPATVVDPEPKK